MILNGVVLISEICSVSGIGGEIISEHDFRIKMNSMNKRIATCLQEMINTGGDALAKKSDCSKLAYARTQLHAFLRNRSFQKKLRGSLFRQT